MQSARCCGPWRTEAAPKHGRAITPGTLYIVATPIGNLEDLSFRALRVLKEVDLIACEDTRHTARLLAHYGIGTPRRSYHEHNEAARAAQLLALLAEGKSVALVSDAGTPLISDPGHDIVNACRDAGIPVVPIPGPSAAVLALAGSGLPGDSFFFNGFLPSKAARRRERLAELARIPATLIFYEAPHRIVSALRDMAEMLGPRQACVARELTKLHEEWLQGSLPELLEKLGAVEPRGEFTVIVSRGQFVKPDIDYPASIRQHVAQEMERTGLGRSEALKAVARQRGIPRREAYRLLVEEQEHPSDFTE